MSNISTLQTRQVYDLGALALERSREEFAAGLDDDCMHCVTDLGDLLYITGAEPVRVGEEIARYLVEAGILPDAREASR